MNLEDVRRGQFEGLREAARRDPLRRPDIGGPELHPTAGASAVGARSFLIAYNIYLQAANLSGQLPAAAQQEVAAARAIARAIRASDGGLYGVKAIGISVNGRAQLSMNITDHLATSVPHLHATVRDLARTHGVHIAEGELIGLIPQSAYDPAEPWLQEIPGFDPDAKVLERRLNHPLPWPGA